jgi:triosephosphate isomerase
MTKALRPLVAGNWKMHGRMASIGEVDVVKERLARHSGVSCDIMICPPAPYIIPMVEAARAAGILVGGQDCSQRPDGAHTGDISAPMLADAGCHAVIVGHSERRTDHGESDELVRGKAEAVHFAGLTAIICIGETQEQHEAGQTHAVLERQLAGSVPQGAEAANTVIAYEPVWAIGSGRTPTTHQVAAAHALMHRLLTARFGAEGEGMRLLYGGSVKPANAAELMAIEHVDGALVGGASLKGADFWGIIEAYLG